MEGEEGGPTPPQQQPPISPTTTDESVSSLSAEVVLAELNRRLGIVGDASERTNDMVTRLAAFQMQNADASARANVEFREMLTNSMAATNRAVNQMATAIGSAARGPLGGAADADSDADAFATRSTPTARPAPPSGSWLNDPDDGMVDPTTFRLPASPAKTLGYHDVMKGEASALKILGEKLRLDKRYSERYNNDAFLLVVATAHKRDVAEYMSAIDMYHGNNAISIRRKFIRAKWEKNKMVEQPGSSLWVLSVDHDTRMEHVVEVDAASFEVLNRQLLTDQEADSAMVMACERHPFMKDGDLSDTQLDELNQWYGHEFTLKETRIGTVLPQYRDQGVRFDRLRNSYVQNNQLFHRHLIASEQEFEVTANAMGKLYYAFCKQDVVGRDELDCLPSLDELIAKAAYMPNLFRRLREEVQSEMPAIDDEKVRQLRLFKRTILSRFNPEKHRFSHLIVALQELNTEIYKYSDKSSLFTEDTLLLEIMDTAIEAYADAPYTESSGYLEEHRALTHAWKRRHTDWISPNVAGGPAPPSAAD